MISNDQTPYNLLNIIIMITLISTALLLSRTVLAMVDDFPTAQEQGLFFVHYHLS
jgi:hypothetical protein